MVLGRGCLVEESFDFDVEIITPEYLETACRVVRVTAGNLAQVFEEIDSELRDDEYISRITVRVSEDELARLVWDFIEGDLSA